MIIPLPVVFVSYDVKCIGCIMSFLPFMCRNHHIILSLLWDSFVLKPWETQTDTHPRGRCKPRRTSCPQVSSWSHDQCLSNCLGKRRQPQEATTRFPVSFNSSAVDHAFSILPSQCRPILQHRRRNLRLACPSLYQWHQFQRLRSSDWYFTTAKVATFAMG